jgi:hypothetical protein
MPFLFSHLFNLQLHQLDTFFVIASFKILILSCNNHYVGWSDLKLEAVRLIIKLLFTLK